jgi:hypothetical protein
LAFDFFVMYFRELVSEIIGRIHDELPVRWKGLSEV